MKKLILTFFLAAIFISIKSSYADVGVKPLSPISILEFSQSDIIIKDENKMLEQLKFENKINIPKIDIEEYHKKHLSIKVLLNMVDSFKVLDVLA